MSDQQMRLVPEAVPEWEDATVPLDALPTVMEIPPKSLVESVRRFGVLQPIIAQSVGPKGDRGEELYTLIAGRRRVAAARAAGLEMVPARILTNAVGEINPDALLLIENAERGPNVAAEARAIKALMEQGNTIHDIALATGMKSATIKKRMALVALPPAIMDAIEAGKLAPGVAAAVAKLHPSQVAVIAQVLREGRKVTLDVVQDQRKVTVSGTAQAVFAGVVAGLGGARERITPQAQYNRAQTHLERLEQELPEGRPPEIAAALATLRDALAEAAAQERGEGAYDTE